MDRETRLITLYLMICKSYTERSCWVCQRFSNGGYKRFTDEEAMTLYIFGILMGFKAIKPIYQYAHTHWLDYFPALPGYSAFVYRLNQLGDAFKETVLFLQGENSLRDDERVYLVDSMPISLAKHQHAYTAKVATEFASKSYNGTKKMYYYGVKAHIVGRKNQESLPDIELFMVDGAGRQDGPNFDELLRPHLHNNLAFGDQAYRRPDEDRIEMKQDLKVYTPIQKQVGQKGLPPAEKAFSKAVSAIRQLIEALLAWLNRITGIQEASLVRSTTGLITHIFGRLAAALFLKQNPNFDF